MSVSEQTPPAFKAPAQTDPVGRARQGMGGNWALLSLFFIIIATSVASFLAYNFYERQERARGQARIEIYERTIENELSRLRHLPAFLGQQDEMMRAIEGKGLAALNQKLQGLAQDAQAEAIYVLNRDGLTIAASNFDQPKTFIGQNYGFRPYFKQAIGGAEAQYYAIGATTARPGYFLAAPVGATTPSGVVVVKLDLTALNSTLEASGDTVLVTNDDGIVVLAASADLLYRALDPLGDEARARLAREKAFGDQDLSPLGWVRDGDMIDAGGARRFAFAQDLSVSGWSVIYVQDRTGVLRATIGTAALFCAALVFLALLAGILRETRVRQALDISQRDRARLQDEVEMRKQIETRLEAANANLRQTEKMAALGQLAASVTHELGQPISAMRNHLAAEELGGKAPKRLLSNLGGIVTRMENVAAQLRFFASRAPNAREEAAPNALIEAALAMMSHDLDGAGVRVELNNGADEARLDVVKDRLERVFINIIQNAIRAMGQAEQKVLDIAIRAQGDQIVFAFGDQGRGLAGQSIDTLTEPFHTTEASGDGMGLGLAISDAIVKEHGGHMEADDRAGGGAEFRVILPRVTGG